MRKYFECCRVWIVLSALGQGAGVAWGHARAQDSIGQGPSQEATEIESQVQEGSAPPRAEESQLANAGIESAVDESELAAIVGDVSEYTSDGPSFKVYGFADMSIARVYFDEGYPFRDLAVSTPFTIGNVNLYFASNLMDDFRSLLEVRLTYMPSGTFDATGKVETTFAADSANFGRYDTWGGIVLQRVHLDYSPHGLFNVRVGQFLTPYGIWNVDHGSPTVISVIKPYPIGNVYFPERQVGLEVFGSQLVGSVSLGYHVTVSNGRSDVPAMDFDKNKALGGRLFVAADGFGSLKLGVSAYGGRATHDASTAASFEGGELKLRPLTGNQYDEFAVAGDLLWEWRNLRVQGEAIISQVRYTDGGRRIKASSLGVAEGFVADHRAWACYGLVGYRLPWLSIMPFVLIDSFHHAAGAGSTSVTQLGDRLTGYNFGLNIRPVPAVVLKAQGILVRSANDPSGDAVFVTGQVAWAF